MESEMDKVKETFMTRVIKEIVNGARNSDLISHGENIRLDFIAMEQCHHD